MGEQPRAGREARPLQHAVDHPHDAHEEDQRIVELRTRTLARDPLAHVDAETEGEIGQRAERESVAMKKRALSRSARIPLTKRERP